MTHEESLHGCEESLHGCEESLHGCAEFQKAAVAIIRIAKLMWRNLEKISQKAAVVVIL
jgi:hypothetical protein